MEAINLEYAYLFNWLLLMSTQFFWTLWTRSFLRAIWRITHYNRNGCFWRSTFSYESGTNLTSNLRRKIWNKTRTRGGVLGKNCCFVVVENSLSALFSTISDQSLSKMVTIQNKKMSTRLFNTARIGHFHRISKQ